MLGRLDGALAKLDQYDAEIGMSDSSMCAEEGYVRQIEEAHV